MAALSATPRAALVAGLVLACASASPLVIEELPGPGPGVRVGRIAVPPPIVDPRARAIEPDAVAVIGSRLVEALATQGELELVGPEEVATWLSQRGLALDQASPQQLGGELALAFGADAVLFGVVRRYVSRVGGPHGATQPAAVWFDLELRLPEGTPVFRGSYREEQQALSDDVLSLPRAAERGFEWLDAPGLATYGSRELVRALAEERRKWK
jgi:pimeloyl-ACP methyl ester carboxylesterase